MPEELRYKPPKNKSTRKLWYQVSLSAESESTGWVKLTEDEAKVVEYATSIKNWENRNIESWCGAFHIDAANPRLRPGR